MAVGFSDGCRSCYLLAYRISKQSVSSYVQNFDGDHNEDVQLGQKVSANS